MESRTISARPDVAVASTSVRVTPTPPRAARFGEVLTNTVVRSAESAMRVLPGSPMMAVAVRGATGTGALGVPMNPMSGPMSPMSGGAGIDATGARTTATGTGSSFSNAAGPGAPGTATPGTGVGAGGDAGGIEASLQQSQDMNIYYLRVQESVNAQNRQFTTLSNLLKAEHDTVKTAIGNIR